jgi:hypothetical protein
LHILCGLLPINGHERNKSSDESNFNLTEGKITFVTYGTSTIILSQATTICLPVPLLHESETSFLLNNPSCTHIPVLASNGRDVITCCKVIFQFLFGITGLLNFASTLNNTIFRELNLFPSSGEGMENTLFGAVETANLNHWTQVISDETDRVDASRTIT